MVSRNEARVYYMMRLHDLRRVYQMILHERSVLDSKYICSEIEEAERELDKLNNSKEEQ